MSVTIAREEIRALFKSGSSYIDSSKLTKDDDSTPAIWDCRWYWGETPIRDTFYTRANDVMFILTSMGVQSVNGASGLLYRVVRTGVQAVAIEKNGIDPDRMVEKATAEIYRVIDTYYASSEEKQAGDEFPNVQRIGSMVIFGPTVEVLTKIYGYAVATGTETIKRWMSLKIGYGSGSGQYTEITDGIITVEIGRPHMGVRQFTANPVTATSMTQGHSSVPFSLTLHGDMRAAFYTQPVTGAGGNPALVENGDSNKIGYLAAICSVRMGDGTSKIRTYSLMNAYILSDDGPRGQPPDTQIIYMGDAEYKTVTDA